MGDLELETRVERVGEGYRANVPEGWRVWSPCGGFLSALALRAAMSASSLTRPASYACHYLNAAEEGAAELTVTVLRASRRVESLEVALNQGERAVLRALVWSAAAGTGVDHDTAVMPDVKPPADYPVIDDLVPGWPPFRFWRNFEYRPVLVEGQVPYVAGRAITRGWLRFTPTPTFADPTLAAIRLLILADIFVYPAAQWAHPFPTPFRATSLDLAVTIHDVGLGSEWLLVDAEAPAASEGLLGGHVRVWSDQGRLLADSVQQMLQLVQR